MHQPQNTYNYDNSARMFNDVSDISSPLRGSSRINERIANENFARLSQQTDELKQSHNSENKDDLLESIFERYMEHKKRMMKTRCFVTWKYQSKYERSMTIKSSPIAHQVDDQFELSNSSFLQLSTSNDNQTMLQKEDLENTEQPRSFRDEYNTNYQVPSFAQEDDPTQSQCKRFFGGLEEIIARNKRF